MDSSPDRKPPLVSVVMPVLNAGKFGVPAARSILEGSLGDLELIVIDDGSSDGSVAEIAALQDSRIRIVNHSERMGLARSFNDGIGIARGTFIARMDSDDIAEPGRLAEQVTFLRSKPNIGIVGTWTRIIDEDGRLHGIVQRPATTRMLKWHALFSTPFVHPTVMARAGVLKENPYDERLAKSEDYELWGRLLWERDTQAATIQHPLLRYRQWSKGTTASQDLGRGINSAANTLRNLRRYVPVNEAEAGSFLRFKGDGRIGTGDLRRIMGTYARAFAAFRKREESPPGETASMALYLARTFIGLSRRLVRGR